MEAGLEIEARAKQDREREIEEYPSRRWGLAKEGWPWDDMGAGFVTGLLGWVVSDQDPWSKVAGAVIGGLIGLLVWHYVKIMWRWAVRVPLDQHLKQYDDIQGFKSKLVVYQRSIEGLNNDIKRAEALHAEAIQQERRRFDEAQENWRAQNNGVMLECYSLRFWRDEIALYAIADVENLANGNTVGVSLRVDLCAPFRVGGSQIIASTRPRHAPLPDTKSEVRHLTPVIDLEGKRSTGPGYFQYVFSKSYLAGFPFHFGPNAPLEKMAEELIKTELYFRIRDYANKSSDLIIDAPGTLVKRHERRAREHAEARGTNTEPNDGERT